MKPNVGSTERVLRIAAGIFAGYAGLKLVRSNGARVALGAMSASLLESGISRYCLMSDALGIDNAPDLLESPVHEKLRMGPRPPVVAAMSRTAI